MRDIINRFNTKSEINMDKAKYLYGGNQVNLELTFYEQANNIDKQRKEMNILVDINESITSNNQSTIKSKEIICPKCKENCLISFENYQIHLYYCKNGHEMYNIPFEDFNNSQNINENEIKCNNCNNTKYQSYKKQFYKCLNCNINLCPLCNQKHDKTHEIIDYNNINYICSDHKDFYVSYCKDCKINLCMKCEMKHNNHHEIINYKNILPDEDQIKKELKIFKDKIDKLKETIEEAIKELTNKLNNIYDNFQKLYKISYDIVYNYNLRQRNYEILENVNSVKDLIKEGDIYNIIGEEIPYIDKFLKLDAIFNKMTLKTLPEVARLYVNFYFNRQGVTIQALKDEMFAETALRYINAMGFSRDDHLIFFYNSMELRPETGKTLSDYKISNNSRIDVINCSLVYG